MRMKFDWEEALDTGNALIDKQHKKLVDDINYLVDNLVNFSDKFLIEKLLKAIIYDAVKHFRDEEAELRKIKYTEYKSHVNAHIKLENGLEKIIKFFDEDEVDYENLALSIKLNLLDHFLVHDRGYITQMRNNGV